MRTLIKATLQHEKTNDRVREGELGKLMKSILDELKPEHAFFTTENGKRTAYLVVNLTDPSQMPALAEPLFLAFNADVQFTPVMTAEDLMKAQPAIESAVKKYGETRQPVGR